MAAIGNQCLDAWVLKPSDGSRAGSPWEQLEAIQMLLLLQNLQIWFSGPSKDSTSSLWFSEFISFLLNQIEYIRSVACNKESGNPGHPALYVCPFSSLSELSLTPPLPLYHSCLLSSFHQSLPRPFSCLPNWFPCLWPLPIPPLPPHSCCVIVFLKLSHRTLITLSEPACTVTESKSYSVRDA